MMDLRLLAIVAILGTAGANQCGLPYITPNTNSGKIVGGTNAIKGSWPWQVRLGYRRSSWFGTSIDLICGGSIVNWKYIVTAAHCVDHDTDTTKYVVTAGDYDRSTIETNERNYEVIRIIIHPSYDSSTTDNDIAILEVEGQIEFNREVWPICLPSQNSDPAPGTKCFATGWGDTEASEWKSVAKGQSLLLQQVAVSVISRNACYSNFYPGLISNAMVCAGYPEGGRDPCKADSGGPLACRNQYGGYDLAGVISWGHGCGWPKQPGIYARVGSFANWISDNTRL